MKTCFVSHLHYLGSKRFILFCAFLSLVSILYHGLFVHLRSWTYAQDMAVRGVTFLIQIPL
jgi:hypothetical protein